MCVIGCVCVCVCDCVCVCVCVSSPQWFSIDGTIVTKSLF